eukprot:jgi/Hompol1/2393/HPOL_005979-RA
MAGHESEEEDISTDPKQHVQALHSTNRSEYKPTTKQSQNRKPAQRQDRHAQHSRQKHYDDEHDDTEAISRVDKQIEFPMRQVAEDGVRRSRRTKVAPLAYWKNERVVYGRRVSGVNPVPTSIKDVIRAPPDDLDTNPLRRNRSRSDDENELPPVTRVVNYLTGGEEEQ